MTNRLDIFRPLIFIITLMLLASCSREEKYIILTVEDIADQKIALEKGSLSDMEISTRLPYADYKSFNSISELLLALSSGKFDAAVISAEHADDILEETQDYELIDEETFEEDSIRIIVHKSRRPGRNIDNAHSGGFVDKSFSRVKDNITSEYFVKLISWGFLITITIFVGSWILAMAIAVFMTLLSFRPKLRFLWNAIMLFIRTIHDVPSVVLIFFFYYIVFAQVNTDGILACIVALGVYGSGSFANVIHVHLNEVDPMEHKAAHMLGLKGWKKYRLVILPQAVKSMLPFFLSESKVLLRATTFAGYVSILDLVKVSELIRNQTYDALVPLVFVSIVFLFLSWLIKEGLYLSYNKLFANDRN